MSIFSPLIQAWTWFTKVVVDHIKSTAQIAVVITETVKAILDNPIASFLENIADGITHTNLPTEIANAVNAEIPKILAIELGIQGLPDNPTPDQILAFENSVLTAFGVTSDKSKLYTTLAAQIYGRIQTTISTTPGKFADWVKTVEESWEDYQADLAANPGIVNAPVGTVLPDGNTVVESASDALAEANSAK